jgi:hypothetical protein
VIVVVDEARHDRTPTELDDLRASRCAEAAFARRCDPITDDAHGLDDSVGIVQGVYAAVREQ